MKMIRRRLAAAAALLALGAPALAVEGPWQHRDAREQAPAALIGPWKADLTASRFATKPPRKALRFFAYTADGKILVTFMTLTGDGKLTSGHWAAQLDGTPAIEYHSDGGSTPFNVVRFTKVDEADFTLTVSRNGKVEIEATYQLSADGKTLVYAYDGNRIVYRRWDQLD